MLWKIKAYRFDMIWGWVSNDKKICDCEIYCKWLCFKMCSQNDCALL